ncbi:MAG: FtsL-like putative cell division protein [Candidatus Azobacteroides sp.]|nr:FtsL-like putative cell division protein [Candidatus Azobacteroides sp.]
METNYKQPKKRRKKKFSLPDILGGEILNEDFIVKQSKLLIMIAVCFVFFIGNRYSCLKKITQIEDLKKELKDLRYENLVVLTKLTENSRQSQIENLVNSKGLNLSCSNGPVYEIEK